MLLSLLQHYSVLCDNRIALITKINVRIRSHTISSPARSGFISSRQCNISNGRHHVNVECHSKLLHSRVVHHKEENDSKQRKQISSNHIIPKKGAGDKKNWFISSISSIILIASFISDLHCNHDKYSSVYQNGAQPLAGGRGLELDMTSRRIDNLCADDIPSARIRP